MDDYIVADSSFYCCCESDIKNREFLLFLLTKYNFFIGKNIMREIPKALTECDEFLKSVFFTGENFFELIRPLFTRSSNHEIDGEYEAIGIAYHLNEHFHLKYLILDDIVAYKWTKKNFSGLSGKLTRTIGFIKNSCYDDKRVSPIMTMNVLLEMKKSFEEYNEKSSENQKRPCSMDKKVYNAILIPLIAQLEDDNKNGRI